MPSARSILRMHPALHPSLHERHDPATPATIAPAFRLGYPALDALSPLRAGALTFLDHPPHAATYGLVAQAAAQGGVLVVDGANRFDALPLAACARRLGLDAAAVLRRLRVARASTPRRMQALLEEALPRLLPEARLALVIGVADQFLDHGAPHHEGWVLWRRALRVLGEAARRADAPVVMTDHGALRRQARHRALALERADEAIAFEPGGRPAGAIVARLPKRGVALACRREPATQRALDGWRDPPASAEA